MNDALKWLTIVGYVLPLINSIVRLVETFPGLTGAQKKEQALALVEAMWNGLAGQNPAIKIKEIQGVPFDVFKPLVGLLIDTVVTIFNAVGVFTKSGA